MALNFPNNPSVNDTVELAGKTFQYDGVKWRMVYVVTPTPPTAQALAPTITEVSTTTTSITFTITNNDASTAVILYELDDTTPDANSIELAAAATSGSITISDLASDTAFDVYATANVTGKVKSNVTELAITTDPAPEFGIQWTQSTDTVVRLADAVGLSSSDFDTIEPFASMRRCMVNDDLSINYYIDPSDPDDIGEVVNTGTYTTGDPANYTGSHGQVMVEIPKFYYKTAEPSTGVYQWFVSMSDLAGYSVHPAFITDSATRDYIYMSAFEGTAATSTGTLRSISGVQPLADRTLPQYRTQAQDRGTGWQIQTYQTTQALQALYLIEYADFDTQTTIGKGYVEAAAGSGNNSINTGATISLGNTSGSVAGGTDGLRAISYRGVENWYGNIRKLVDGINIEANFKAFIANDSFESDKFTSPYVLEGTLSSGSGFISDILFPQFLAITTSGSSTTFLHDNQQIGTGNKVVTFGGAWFFNNGQSGGFCWDIRDGSTTAGRASGSRIQIL